jgi:hypothetical protein
MTTIPTRNLEPILIDRNTTIMREIFPSDLRTKVTTLRAVAADLESLDAA